MMREFFNQMNNEDPEKRSRCRSQAPKNARVLFRTRESERRPPGEANCTSARLRGISQDSLEPFLACARMTMLWPTEECNIFTLGTLPGKRHGGWRCPAIIVQNRIGDECDFVESGDRRVAVEMRTPKRMLISADLPTTKALLEDCNFPLHEVEQLIRKFPDHEVMLGIDANTKVCGLDQTPSQQSLLQRNRRDLLLLSQFLTLGLMIANTWGREEMV